MNIDMWRRKNSRAIIGSVWPLGISLGVVLFALRPSIGTTPMLFDDYQFAYEHGQMGWIDHAARLFRSWTGRVLMNIASGPVTSLPSSFTRWAGTFCVAVGCLSIALTLNFLVRNADQQSDLRSKDGNTVALILTTSLVWLAGIPAWFQTTQWMAGQLVYLLPVCCAFGGGSLCWKGWARGDLSSRMQRTGGTLLLMIAASGNETLAISIPVALFLLFACNAKSGVPGHRSARTKKVVLSGAVLLAASVVLLAPGSRVRGRAVPNDRSLDAIGQRITDGLGVFSSVSILTMLLPSIALVVLGNQLSPHILLSVRDQRSLWWACCGGLLSSTATYVLIPAFTLTGAGPIRAMLPIWGWLSMLAFLSGGKIQHFGRITLDTQGGRTFHQLPKSFLCLVAVSAAMLAFVVTQYPAAIKQKAFYARWQCVDQAARRATNSNFRVSAPESIENVFFLTAEPNSWPNLWAARYYGLGSIASTSDPVAVCFVILGS